ncbi:MAG TPA: DAK2 domain-containing protein [Streptosporangiaceae bacterium]|jgi:hypothetical protein
MAAALLDAPALRRWTELSARALADARAAIDAINVFPVADGDTGTNLYLTVTACAEAVAVLPGDADPTRVWATLTRAALLNAHGNSGVLWSQALRGLSEILADRRTDGAALRDALTHAARLAREAVQHPVEGTLLTILDAAAAGAAEPRAESPAEVARAAADAARRALASTPGQLRVLAEGGVVDAGAAGLCLLLDALAAVASGQPVRPLDLTVPPATLPPAQTPPTAGHEAGSRTPPAPGTPWVAARDEEASTPPATRTPSVAAGEEEASMSPVPRAPSVGAGEVGGSAPPAPGAPWVGAGEEEASMPPAPRAPWVAAGEVGGFVPPDPGAPWVAAREEASMSPVPRAPSVGAGEVVASMPPAPGAPSVGAGEVGGSTRPDPRTPSGVVPGEVAAGAGFEVMFLVDSDEGRVAELRAGLDGIGDSLLIVGGDGTWQVHVHTGDAGAAIECGVRAGHAYRFRVSCLRPHPPAARTGRGVIALAAGPWRAELFPYADTTALDAPSADALLAAIGARAEVAVVPCSPESHALARAAIARGGGELVPADAAVRQVAAFAVHDPERPFAEDTAAMADAARAVRVGRLTSVEGGYRTSGDGVPDAYGTDPVALAAALAESMLATGGELLTIIDGGQDGLGERVRDAVARPGVAAAVYRDPALGHPLELGVE